MIRNIFSKKLWALLFWLGLACGISRAQTTAFTYQGKLTDGSASPTATYDFQFGLYDENGNRFAVTNISGVQVTNGTFTVQLDFGAGAFPGASRSLEIAVKRPGDSSYTTLSPRQPVTSTPYALRSLSVDKFSVNGPYNNGGSPPTAYTASNTFAGENAGANTTPSSALDFFAGKFNSFFGVAAGKANTIATSNSFFGAQSGLATNTGEQNSFFGSFTGRANTGGHYNTIVGAYADFSGSNTTGSKNTALGFTAKVQANVFNATAIGAHALVTQSNSLVLGAIGGTNDCVGDCSSVNVGIGTTAPSERLHVVGNSFFDGRVGIGASPDARLTISTPLIGPNVSQIHYGINGDWFIRSASILGRVVLQDTGGNVGIGDVPGYKLDVVGRSRFRQNNGAGNTGATNSAGFWLYQNTPAADRAFVGMKDDNNVGFYGNNGGNWSLVVHIGTGNVGIGTDPSVTAKLKVDGGDAAIIKQGNGIILRAIDGPLCYRLTVNNVGALSTTPIACP